ncbi:unnamed protein product [Urochloa humidicola]
MGARPSKGRSSPPSTGLPPDLSSPSSSPWMDLQPDLADLLLRHLTSHADRIRFAAVCHHWRYVAREYSPHGLPPPLPWVCFPKGAFKNLSDGKWHFFRTREQDTCNGTFGNWQLFEEEERRHSRHYYLKNLLSGAIMRLPGRFDECICLNPDGSRVMSSTRRWSEFKIRKVIVCSDDLVAAKVSYYLHCSEMQSVVVCCRPGMSSWSRGLSNGHWYVDMAFYGQKLYAVTRKGHIFAHEISTNTKPWVYQIEQVIPAPSSDGFFLESPCAMSCYLVISHTGKLLMVRWVRTPQNKEVELKVFEADLKMLQWLEVKSLDDQVLFVSSDCSKAISASSDGDYMEGNKIYLADYNLNLFLYGSSHTNESACVNDMTSNKFQPLSLGGGITRAWHVAWVFP